MRIVIFDDDMLFASDLEVMIHDYLNKKEISDVYIKTINDEKSIYNLSLKKDDILFLDISTSENDDFGIEAAMYLRDKNIESHVIFVTSHNEKIRDILCGLVRPSEFLIKPLNGVERERLFKVLDAIVHKVNEHGISLNVGNMTYYVSLNEILYIRKENRKTVIHTQDRSIMTRESFSSVFERLGEGFAVIDKGTAVNLSEIRAFNPKKRFLYLRNGTELYYARDRAKELRYYLVGKEVRK